MATQQIQPTTSALAISFEAGTDTVGFPALPFEQMLARLRTQMDTHCAPLLNEINTLANEALASQVTDDQSLMDAAAIGKQLAGRRRFITEYLKPTKRAIDAVKGVFLGKEKELTDAIALGEEHLKRICTTYRVAKEREEKERAEAERKRQLKEAEDKRLADAQKALDAGRNNLADALLSAPVATPKVEERVATPKGAGRGRVNYRFRVLDFAQVPREWLMLDESKVGKYARDSKLPDHTLQNGIEFYQEPDTSF